MLVHESAHLLGLRLWGDPTPKEAGRDHINPLRQIDALGTILAPAAALAINQVLFGMPVLLGWTKPVPVDFSRLSDPRKGPFWVALLGPLSNLAFTEDSPETILKLLRDARNQPFYESLGRWLAEHEVFAKMASPHAKKKLRDALREGQAERSRSAEIGGATGRGLAVLALLVLAILVWDVLQQAGIGVDLLSAWGSSLGMGAALLLGNISLRGAGELVPKPTKIQADAALPAGHLVVEFRDTDLDWMRSILALHHLPKPYSTGSYPAIGQDPPGARAELRFAEEVSAAWAARALSSEIGVKSITVGTEAAQLALSPDAPLSDPRNKVFRGTAPGGMAPLLYTARNLGGADILPELESILAEDPASISPEYEQSYFEAPLTWATVLARNGKFPEYAPKIQQMLLSPKPMVAAAALYAIALEQSRNVLGAGREGDTPAFRWRGPSE